MKARLGFVSNSSSSSFIVSVPCANVEEDGTIMLAMDPSKVFDAVISTKEQLDKQFLEQYGWGQKTIEELIEAEGEHSWIDVNYRLSLEKIEQGNVILYGDFEYGDTGAIDLVRTVKGAKVICDE